MPDIVQPQQSDESGLLVVNNVSMTYRTRKSSIEALSALSMDVSSGEFISVIGPSGCGKSTLLKIVSGLVKHTAGTVTLDDKPVLGPRPDIGIVFQKPTLLPWKTVFRNVVLPAKALKMDSSVAEKRAHELLSLTGLGGFEKNYPGELSGGMQQRVGLARMLVHDPKFLLMDEPFAALDALTREFLMLELQSIWMRTKKSVLFITHSIPEAVFLSDRVVVMSGRPGRIRTVVPITFDRPRALEAMVEEKFGEICNELRNKLRN